MVDIDSAKVDQAVSGDAEALRAILERHGPQIWNEIRTQIGRRWRSVLDADDVMQVTYTEAFLRIGLLEERSDAGFVNWLRRIAQNNLRDALRALQSKKRPSPALRIPQPESEESCEALLDLLGVDSATPSREAAGREASKLLRAALEALPPEYARAVVQYDLNGLDIDEVAREMGRSRGAVHMLRARAHEYLRSLLGNSTNFLSGA